MTDKKLSVEEVEELKKDIDNKELNKNPSYPTGKMWIAVVRRLIFTIESLQEENEKNKSLINTAQRLLTERTTERREAQASLSTLQEAVKKAIIRERNLLEWCIEEDKKFLYEGDITKFEQVSDSIKGGG